MSAHPLVYKYTVFVRDADLTKLAVTCLIFMKIKQRKLNMTLGRIKFRYRVELTTYSDADLKFKVLTWLFSCS